MYLLSKLKNVSCFLDYKTKTKGSLTVKTHNWAALGFALIFAVCTPTAEAVEHNHTAISKRVIKETEKAYGPDAASRIVAWSDLVKNSRNKPITEKLALTNNFFNRVPIKSEKELLDHTRWSTPYEMLTRNAGSHADHVVAKYVTLEAMGVSINQMRITHVHSMKSPDLSYTVLTYQSEPGVMPLVLDTTDSEIKPANERTDLFPEHSLNDDGLWLSKKQKDERNDAQEEALIHVELWNEMNARMDKEHLSDEEPSSMK